jgi:thiamine-phosphate diphosphorylase
VRAISLHLIVDCRTRLGSVADALRGGVDAVQLRDKGVGALELYRVGKELRDLTRRHRAALLINDRIDVALALGADGVHLSVKSLPAKAARQVAGDLVLGASVHEVEEVVALGSQVDYLTFGHVFPSASHPGAPPKGLAALAEACALAACPVLAIGGVTPENVAEVVRSGAAGVVVIRAVHDGEGGPYEAARRLRQALDRAPAAAWRRDPVLSGGGAR